MAGGNMGDLWFSLDIKEKVNQKLEKLTGKIDNATTRINGLRDKINEAGEALGNLEKGSKAWDEQKTKVEGYFRKVSELINYIKVYEEALGRVQRIDSRIKNGGLLGPSRKVTSLQDTKPLEDQINKYEALVRKIQSIQAKIRERQGYKDSIRLDAEQGTKGMATWNEYQQRIQAVDAEINKLSADLKSLGGQTALDNAQRQLESFYAILEQYDAANRRAIDSTHKLADTRSHAERQRDLNAALGSLAQKDAEKMDQLAAAERREAEQQKANQANIEATNRARQRSVQVLREEAEAMMRNHIAALQAQKTSLGRLYSQGKSLGLDPAELETILNRYKEIAQQLLNMRTMMQNPGSMGYRDMFSMGRFAGVGANYVKEASQQVSGLRQRTQEAAMAARELASAFDRVHSSASKSSQVLNDIKSLFMQGGIVFAAQQFANSIIKTGGDIVQQHIALRSILGDVQKADTLFAQTQQLALQSPFTFQELNRDVKQLAAFGVDTDRLYDTTKRLADVASGLGVSFERLGLAYGQVKARSWLDGKELRQFAYAGLPMLQKIADLYNETGKNGKRNYTTSDVRTMITKRQVSFEDVDEVFKRLTDEGGQFYNMQFVLSNTLLGRWNKLQDAWTIMLGKFADGKNIIGQTFMFAINLATELVQSIDKLGPVFAAAFSGVAFKKLTGVLGANLGASILNAKSSLALEYEKSALAGENLNNIQRQILTTKGLITTADMKALVNAKAINAQELRRLYLTKQISTAQYQQLMGMNAIGTKVTRLTAYIRLLRMQGHTAISGLLTRFSAGIGLIGTGLKGLGSSILGFLGGIPGIILTGITMVGMKLWQDHAETEEHIKSASDLVQQKHQDLQKYMEDNPLRLSVDTGEITKQIDQEKETLKEKAGSLYDTIRLNEKENVKVGDYLPGGDLENQLQYLRSYTQLLDEAQYKAKSLYPAFEDAINNADGWFSQDIPTNLKQLEDAVNELQVVLPKLNMKDLVEDAKAIKADDENNIGEGYKKIADYILEANKNGKSLTETLSGIRKLIPEGGWDEANDFLPDYIKKDGKNQGATFTPLGGFVNSVFNVQERSKDLDSQIQEVADSMAGQFQNLAKDPMEQAIYSTLKDAWKSANQLDVIQGNYFDMKLDKAMGLQDFPSLAEDVAKDAASRMSEETKRELASGQPLTESAKTDMNRARSEAMDNLRNTWPGTASEIQAVLNSQRFNINVWMHILGDDSATQDALDSLYKPSGKNLSRNADAFYKIWSQGAATVADVEKNARADVDRLYGIMESAKRQKKGVSAATSDYNNAVAATTEVLGYTYKGSATGTTKKIQDAEAKRQKDAAAQRKRQQAIDKARREAERRERAYLRARQKEEQSIQKYYETYKTWRQIEGENRAKARVSADDRFKNISGTYTDPSELAENYKKLAESIEKASGGYKKMSDERKQLYNDLMAKAADAEADIMLEKAKDQISAFKEMLDLMSKRYDWYQRLAKVAGKESAANFVFGNNTHSSSYYQYLKNRVYNGISSAGGEQLGVDYSNSNPNGSASKRLNTISVVGVSFPKIDLNQLGEGTTLEEALAMPYSKLEKALGEQAIVLQKFKEARDKLDESIVSSLEQGYTYFDDYTAELDVINQKYDEQIERLKERNQLEAGAEDYISDEALAQNTTVLNQQRARDIAAVNYKQLQNSDVYRRFFGAAFLYNSRGAEQAANEIGLQLFNLFKQGAMTADQYASEIQKINDAMKKFGEDHSKVFDLFFGGGIETVLQKQAEQGNALVAQGSSDYEDAMRRRDEAIAKNDIGGQLNAEIDMRKANALKDKGNKMALGAQKAMSAVSIIDKVVNVINNNVQSLKSLFDDIANSIEVFAGKDHADNFRNSRAYAFFSGFSSASQGATDAWNALKSGNIMGVAEGGYRSIIGWAEPWARRHDAKLDKQIQLAERQNKLIEAMRNSIERRLTNTLGGVYGYKSKSSDVKTLKEALDNYSLAKTGARYGRNTIGQSAGIGAGVGAIGGAMGAAIGSAAGPIGAAAGVLVGALIGGLFGHKKKKYRTNYTDDTFKAMQRADQTQEYYDQMFAAYKMQRDNLNAQMKAESKKKSKDKDKIQDYKTQIDELDDKIQTFAKDMAKSLYDIDVKQWASELTNAVVSAWAAGEDAAEAYKNKVKELMRTLAINIASQKIMEEALKPVEEYIEEAMKANSGKLTEENILTIADKLDDAGKSAIPSITELFDKMKERGWDLSDVGSGSMSSSIKGITETTADLLAAYLNAIRADVSVIRQVQGIYLPKLDITATAQLQQLNMIAANTLRNADAAEQISTSTTEILTIFRAVVSDTKRLNVTVR